MRKRLTTALVFGFSFALPHIAMAHTGLGVHTFLEGLAHPLGADHLLAMLAVGVWSVRALPASRIWQGPATFMAALMVGALLGARGVAVPFLEQAIALSVSLLGFLLVLSASSKPAPRGLVLIAAAALLHGLAHGAEAPGSGFSRYAAGFMLTTAVLHVVGIGLGTRITRWFAGHIHMAMPALGAAFGLAGVYLFNQI